MELSVAKIKRKSDGWWVKLHGWGMACSTIEWTRDAERAYTFTTDDDSRLKQVLAFLKKNNVEVEIETGVHIV